MKKEMMFTYKPGANSSYTTPLLKLSNKYLLKYGFKIGSKVIVEYQHNEITIKKLKEK